MPDKISSRGKSGDGCFGHIATAGRRHLPGRKRFIVRPIGTEFDPCFDCRISPTPSYRLLQDAPLLSKFITPDYFGFPLVLSSIWERDRGCSHNSTKIADSLLLRRAAANFRSHFALLHDAGEK